MLKKLLLSTLLLSTIVTAKCECTRNANVCVYCFPMYAVCMQVKLVNVSTYVQILSYKNDVTIP